MCPDEVDQSALEVASMNLVFLNFVQNKLITSLPNEWFISLHPRISLVMLHLLGATANKGSLAMEISDGCVGGVGEEHQEHTRKIPGDHVGGAKS